MAEDELARRRGARGRVTIICPTCSLPVRGYSQINGVTHHLSTRGVNNFEIGEICTADEGNQP